MPVEATENVSPLVFWRKELREGSGGAGLTRGGFGQVMEAPAVRVTFTGRLVSTFSF
jgi:N-methylhydantoinase B